MSIKAIAVLGLGKVGKLAAMLLHESGLTVTGHDRRTPREPLPFPVDSAAFDSPDAMLDTLAGVDAVLSCLPYFLNRSVAEAACKAGIHYFDLTEDVPTTQAIMALAKTANGLMAPQCGLAPGFVCIVAADLIAQFDTCRSCRLRVGALPQHPAGRLGYAFNWSPEGVVNEYLNDCEVIEDGERKWVSAMEWLETIYIDGVKLEAFTTSGGLGTICDTYLGTVANIDYKTIRYPGHADMMNFFFHELLMRERRDIAGQILTHAKPPVEHDIVYMHVAAEGEAEGRLQRREFVRAYKPVLIGGQPRTAIAWTTASAVVAVIDMVRDGILPNRGFLKQERIPLAAFLSTRSGALLDTH